MTEHDSENEKRIVEGWQGRYYEDFEVGDIYKHPYGRTVTEADNVWLTNIAMAPNAIHFNSVYAAENELDEENPHEDPRIVNGIFVIMLAVGMSVMDVSQNAAANLGYDEVRHHAPVYHGDTIFAESEVLHKRESESRNHVGLVETELRAYNQDGDLVLSLKRTPMIFKREYAQPDAATPTGWVEGIGTQLDDLE
jgi:acyl dehydratase